LTQIALATGKATRFVLVGAGYHLCALARLLVAQGFPHPAIVTHPRADHERDRHLLKGDGLYAYVFDVARDLGLDIIESDTINSTDIISILKDRDCEAVFSLSCRSIINKDFIQAFDGKVFNIHPSLLPKERGGGTFSWRIMNGSREISASIHMIDEGIDSGAILLQEARQVMAERPTPMDFLVETNRLYADLLAQFVDTIKQYGAFEAFPQDECEATYFPRLHTETNAAIDWSWSGSDIDRFIRAFAAPYPGAFTFAGNKRIAILDAVFEPAATDYHPYAAGRILARLEDGTVRAIVRDGTLLIKSVAVEFEPCLPVSAISVRAVLHTPANILADAKTTVVAVGRMQAPKVVV
jgi:methionyl-tRNA formyltransferase